MRLQIEVDWVPTIRCMLVYMIDAGWRLKKTLLFGGKAYWLKKETTEATIPADETFGDYETQIREAIQAIAYQETRSEYEVWKDICKLSSIPQPDRPEVVDAMKRANQFLNKHERE
jgi:hypothetical protein